MFEAMLWYLQQTRHEGLYIFICLP